jgi:small-conductance mechanosensitive channel
MNLNEPIVRQVGLLIIVAIVVVVISRIVNASVPKVVADNESRYRLRKSVDGVAFALILIAAIIIFGWNIAGIGVTFGVIGAGIAFALQEVILAVAGWLTITIGNFYRPGDRVKVAGITGDVIDIGVLRTTLMETGDWVDGDLYNGRIVRVSNSMVFKQAVYNYSGEFPHLWDEFKVPIRFGSDYKLARKILMESCEEVVAELSADNKNDWIKLRQGYRLEDAELTPMVTLVVTDNWVEFTVRYVVDYKRRRSTRDDLFVRMLEKIESVGDRVQLGSTTIEITNFNPPNQ